MADSYISPEAVAAEWQKLTTERDEWKAKADRLAKDLPFTSKLLDTIDQLTAERDELKQQLAAAEAEIKRWEHRYGMRF